MADQSIKMLVDPCDITALAILLASDAGTAISGQLLPIDNDMQKPLGRADGAQSL